MKTITAIFLAALLTVVCATQRLEGRRIGLQEQGFPPAYIDGNIDGCNSGSAASGATSYKFTKNVVRFDADSQYRQGWTDGYNFCKADSDRVMRR